MPPGTEVAVYREDPIPAGVTREQVRDLVGRMVSLTYESVSSDVVDRWVGEWMALLQGDGSADG